MINRNIFLIVLFISILGLVFSVNESVIAKELNLPQLARTSVESYLQGKTFNIKEIELINSYRGKIVGVFVTIIDEENKSRGCWGNLYPQTGLKESIVSSAIGAIKKDYRFKPPALAELPGLKFQVSLVSDVIPVSSVREFNPLKDGMMVQSGGKTGILLPGEAIDAHYQMVQCKLKANIQPDEPYNLFRLVTRVYKD